MKKKYSNPQSDTESRRFKLFPFIRCAGGKTWICADETWAFVF